MNFIVVITSIHVQIDIPVAHSLATIFCVCQMCGSLYCPIASTCELFSRQSIISWCSLLILLIRITHIQMCKNCDNNRRFYSFSVCTACLTARRLNHQHASSCPRFETGNRNFSRNSAYGSERRYIL